MNFWRISQIVAGVVLAVIVVVAMLDSKSESPPPSKSSVMGNPSPAGNLPSKGNKKFDLQWGDAMKLSSFALMSTLMLFSTTAFAAVDEPPQAPAECVLNIATGPKGKGYSNLFADIQKACGQTVPICEIETQGGLTNLSKLSTNDADLGLVTLDTMMNMKSSDDNIAALQAVMGLNNNLVHIVTRSAGFQEEVERAPEGTWEKTQAVAGKKFTTTVNFTIDKFSDLKGKTIALVGSAQLIGRALEKQLGYGMNFIDVDKDDQAFEMAKQGKVHAVFTVSGWPSGPVKKLSQGDGLTLVKYDLTPSAPYLVVRKPYQNIGVMGTSFLAVPNMLVTRPFNPKGANGKNVAALSKCIMEHLPDFQEGKAEPAWKEVTDPYNTFGWPRFVPASSELPKPAKKK